jgi:hypothetical protein
MRRYSAPRPAQPSTPEGAPPALNVHRQGRHVNGGYADAVESESQPNAAFPACVIVTAVPPASGPLLGLTLTTVGGDGGGAEVGLVFSEHVVTTAAHSNAPSTSSRSGHLG